MKERLLKRINPNGQLPQEICDAFISILNEKRIPKKTCLLKPGRIAEHIHFIIEGALRSYFIKDGLEITDYFFFEGDLASDYVSLYGGQPTNFF